MSAPAPSPLVAEGEGSRVVDDSVVSAAVGAFRSLRELRLVGCRALCGEGLTGALGGACHGLVRVQVAGCPRVSRARAQRIPGVLGRPAMEVQWREAPTEAFAIGTAL